MYPQHSTSAQASAHANGASSSSSLSSSSSSRHHYQQHQHQRQYSQHIRRQPPQPPSLPHPPQPPHPPRRSSSSPTHHHPRDQRTPTPTLNQQPHSSSPLLHEQNSRYPRFRQQSPQYYDLGSSPEQPQPPSLPQNNKSPAPPPSYRLGGPQQGKPTLLDRRRESLLKNASLRVHPFIAMGNAQGKLSGDSDDLRSGDVVPICTSPVRARWDSNASSSAAAAAAAAAANTGPATPTPTPASTHGRSVSTAPVVEPTPSPFPSSDRPVLAVAHQRAASESASISAAAPAAPQQQPRRALGLVRKMSFRSRGEKATPMPRTVPPVRTSSADDAELLATKEEEPPSAATVNSPPAKLTVSVSHNSSLGRAASLGHNPSPARPIRSARRSAQTAFGTDESPSATPAKTTAREEQGAPSTPTRAINRSLVPRSPTIGPVSPRRGSPGSASPHRQSLSVARRAEREWKAKLAALANGPPSPGRSRLSNGPRPPPRRLQRPSAPPALGTPTDGLSGRMAQSLSLSHLSSLDQADVRMPSASTPPAAGLDSISEYASDSAAFHHPGPAFTPHPGSAFNAPSTVFTGVSKSASTSSIVPRARKSPGSSIVALPGLPEYERTPLSPIEQEPVSPPPPVTPAVRATRALPPPQHSPAPSTSGKSIAPSQKTFGPGPSPITMSRTLDWMPDERVVVSRSSVPDLARVSSPPPVPTVPPGVRLAEKSPPAPAPSCTPSPPRTFSHLPPSPNPQHILATASAATPTSKPVVAEEGARASPIVPPRRSESRNRVHPVAVEVVEVPSQQATTPRRDSPPELTAPDIIPGPGRLQHRRTRSREAAVLGSSILPRTTSLQHARELVARDSPSAQRAYMAERRLGLSGSVNVVEVDEEPMTDMAGNKLSATYDLTPGLDTGKRPRKTGLPMDDLQRWLAQTAVA